MKIYEDYIITKKLNLNLTQLKNNCYDLSKILDKKIKISDVEFGYKDDAGKSPTTTNLFAQYNLFLYTFDGFHDLYNEIKNFFHDCNVSDEKYYIQCWMNIYKKGEFVEWHNHWLPEHNTWHGFYCIDCEPSKTTYMIPNRSDPVDIVSENNLLVMSRSDGDIHRSWPWENGERDRITVAFDIVPWNRIDNNVWLNHWVPI